MLLMLCLVAVAVTVIFRGSRGGAISVVVLMPELRSGSW